MIRKSRWKECRWLAFLAALHFWACDCNCWDDDDDEITISSGGGCGFDCGWEECDGDCYEDMSRDDLSELEFMPDLAELDEYDAPDETIVELCNGFDDDGNGVVDDIEGTLRCGDDCCNGEETALDCPGDCTCEAPTVPVPRKPRCGERLPPAHLVFQWSRSWGNCGVASYDLEVDDSCDPEGIDECLFPDPEIRQTGLLDTGHLPEAVLALNPGRPLPKRYYWRVRSCYEEEICSPWSPVMGFEVGAAVNDLDGDGLGDLAVGIEEGYGQDTDQGRVFVYYANEEGIKLDPSLVLGDPEDLAGSGFAAALSAGGDFDGDTVCDLAVGAESRMGENEGEGAVVLYYGMPGGIRADRFVVLQNPDHVPWSRFGGVLAASGDLNGDGFCDLAVGARLTEGVGPEEGRVYVYYGSGSGIGEFPDVVLRNPESGQRGQFGYALASDGDLDGDGVSDLVVAAPYQDGDVAEEGKFFIYYGLVEGIREMPSVTIENPAASPGHLGMSLSSSGDVSADGIADLVIGAPSQEGAFVGDGATMTCFGMRFSLMPSRCLVTENPEPGLVSSFGASVLLTLDVSGDGLDDAAAGAPGVPGEMGKLYIYAGSETDVSTSPAIAIPGPLQWFGFELVPLGDLGLDGTGDYVVLGYLESGLKVPYLYRGKEFCCTLNVP